MLRSVSRAVCVRVCGCWRGFGPVNRHHHCGVCFASLHHLSRARDAATCVVRRRDLAT